jgi:uncharacterized protein
MPENDKPLCGAASAGGTVVRTLLFGLLLTLGLASACAQEGAPNFAVPADVAFRQADIWSEGTRMAAEVFAPKAATGKKLPTIIMAHGWGGVAATLRPDAIVFARAGYRVISFDYRGWGASDSRLILTAPRAPKSADHRFSAEVQEVREVVDPLDQAADWFSAINWAAGEPDVDTDRIGLWGSSFSGGLVVYVAARDHRVKVVHSQVGALDPRGGAGGLVHGMTIAEEASKRAHAPLGYPPPSEVVAGSLRGAPIRERFVGYAPVDDVNMAPDCAIQFVLAEHEELMNNRNQGIKAYENFKSSRKNLVIVPGISHYGIYGIARAQAQQLALAWFEKYLKP